jgi:hypothetical protein
MSGIHYRAATKRTFKQAIVFLLEHEYKLLGSHRILEMIADDVVELHHEFYRDANQVPPGCLVWHGTCDVGHKQSHGQRAEDEPTVTAVLPLVTDDDINEAAQGCPRDKTPRQWSHERDIRRIVRLVKAGLNNPTGRLLLSQAELSLLVNRSIRIVRRCIYNHYEKSGELLPIKGYVLDRGSKPTHKGIIVQLYEQGMAPPDIGRATNHGLDAVDRYLKDYERVKVLVDKGLTLDEISQAIGRGLPTVKQYYKLVLNFHPEISGVTQEVGHG